MKINFLKFENFTEILHKGSIFRFEEYQIRSSDIKKPRWIIILNNLPPKRQTDRVIFVPLRSDWQKALRLCDCIVDVNIIKDGKHLTTKDGKSAYDLSKIDGTEAQYLYAQYRRNELNYKGRIDKTELDRINKHMRKFFSESPSAEIIPDSYKKIIYP